MIKKTARQQYAEANRRERLDLTKYEYAALLKEIERNSGAIPEDWFRRVYVGEMSKYVLFFFCELMRGYIPDPLDMKPEPEWFVEVAAVDDDMDYAYDRWKEDRL